MKIYAIYKGEENLFDGTVYECAEFLNCQPKTVYHYATKTRRKRAEGFRKSGKPKRQLIAIKLEEEEEDDDK